MPRSAERQSLLVRTCLLTLALTARVGLEPAAAQAPCNEADTVGGGMLGLSPGLVGPPNSLGWDVGSGQCNGSFQSTDVPGFPGGALELGFRAEERRVGQVPRMAGGDYEVMLGPDNTAPPAIDRAWWNFQFSIAYGGAIADLDSLTLQIRTDVGSNMPTSPTVDLLDSMLRAAIDARNNQPNATSGYSELYQVSQNPEFGWFMTASDTDPNPTGAFNHHEEGAWRMRLEAVEGGTEAATEICIHTPNAACVFPLVGAAKLMTPQDGTLPATIQIDYTFENFGTEAALELSVVDDLSTVFGVAGVDWTFTSISSVPVALAHPSFNGSADTQLINQAPSQSLPPVGFASLMVVIELLTTDGADINDQFCNQIIVESSNSLGTTYRDLSAAGTDPDANGNADPAEEGASCFDASTVPVELQSFSVE